MDAELLTRAAIAVAPVLALLMIFDRLDVFQLISFRAICFTVLSGAAIALVSLAANTQVMDGFPIGFSDYTRYVAPAIEETLKALPIVFLFAINRIGFRLDAALAGFALGAGFSVVENVWLLGIYGDRSVGDWVVRGFGTAVMHAASTALFAVVSQRLSETRIHGEASRYRLNPLLFLPGLAIAYAVHSGFNHFAGQPVVALALTLLLAPAAIFLVLAYGERSAHRRLEREAEAHRRMIEEIRSVGFLESEAGRSLAGLIGRFRGVRAERVVEYVTLKLELLLREEEILLAREENRAHDVGEEEHVMFERMRALELELGRPVLAVIAPWLGLSRGELWELQRLWSESRRADRRRSSRTNA